MTRPTKKALNPNGVGAPNVQAKGKETDTELLEKGIVMNESSTLQATPAVVELLCTADTNSLMAHFRRGGDTLILHADGSPFTDFERALVKKATRADFVAAKDAMLARARNAGECARAIERMAGLVSRYATSPKQTTGEVMPLMSPEDRAEFLALARLVRA